VFEVVFESCLRDIIVVIGDPVFPVVRVYRVEAGALKLHGRLYIVYIVGCEFEGV
jgi:hypothetical protein